jgi:hypothetical protein
MGFKLINKRLTLSIKVKKDPLKFKRDRTAETYIKRMVGK